jgi:hypothetical protein
MPSTTKRKKKMTNEIKILSEDLTASSRGRVLPQKYRAVLFKRDGKDLIKVEQPIDGGWHSTGGAWNADDLLNDVSDGISLDFGQQWSVDSGMILALRKALSILRAEMRAS